MNKILETVPSDFFKWLYGNYGNMYVNTSISGVVGILLYKNESGIPPIVTIICHAREVYFFDNLNQCKLVDTIFLIKLFSKLYALETHLPFAESNF